VCVIFLALNSCFSEVAIFLLFTQFLPCSIFSKILPRNLDPFQQLTPKLYDPWRRTTVNNDYVEEQQPNPSETTNL